MCDLRILGRCQQWRAEESAGRGMWDGWCDCVVVPMPSVVVIDEKLRLPARKFACLCGDGKGFIAT